MGDKVKVAPEVSVQEQLNREELECIYRHLKMFVQTNWDHKEDIADACVGCGHYCSKNEYACNPWPAFYKLSDFVDSANAVHQEHLDKQDNGATYP